MSRWGRIRGRRTEIEVEDMIQCLRSAYTGMQSRQDFMNKSGKTAARRERGNRHMRLVFASRLSFAKLQA